ncbi:Arginine--tRNA ligase [Streptococcus parauberis]|nr:Arginine--tRNA ligase [Streptococcus parauberis]
MDTKTLVANEIAKVVPELEQDTIINLIETPKNSEMGDLAFPAFSLAKVLRKAPQMIASDLAEKINADQFEKIVAIGPYINFFLNKSLISQDVMKTLLLKKLILVNNILVMVKTLP